MPGTCQRKFLTDHSDGAQIILYDNGGTATIVLDAEYGAGGDGRITTEVLQITGGSDLSEQFDVQVGASGLLPQAGYVVAIDVDNPGELTVSSQAYDRTMAGVVSGAGDVQSGFRTRSGAGSGHITVRSGGENENQNSNGFSLSTVIGGLCARSCA